MGIIIDIIIRRISDFLTFNFWRPITDDKVPDWVSKRRHGMLPYDKPKYFKGKTFIYKLIKHSDVQGGRYQYYRKFRTFK